MAEEKQFDLTVIGSGPGGYVASIRAAQLGLNVACIEKAPSLGGTCLRVGCIPSKALLESSAHFMFAGKQLAQHGVVVERPKLDLSRMMKRKQQTVNMLGKGVETLFKKNKVELICGTARILGPGALEVESADNTSTLLRSKHILIATGSQPVSLPSVPFDGERIVSSAEALSFENVPEHLVVIGGGYIGLELGSVWKRLGSRVTILEMRPQIFPGMDGETALEAQRILHRQGLEFQFGKKVASAMREGDQCQIAFEGGDTMECSHILVAVGRKPFLEGLGLDSIGIQLDSEGKVQVSKGFETNIPGIYALGDLVSGPMLAHKAEEEAVAFAETLCGETRSVDYQHIPSVVYTHPELAMVGETEESLKEASTAYRKGIFHFRANGRARASGAVDGWVKMLADEASDQILGVHILGENAGELIHEIVVAMKFKATSQDLARICHAHPTFSEAVKESAMAVSDRAIHS